MFFTSVRDDISVNVPNQKALLAEVERKLDASEGFAIATINLDHLEKLRRDEAFADAYVGQDFVVADGNPVVWLSKIARKPVSLVPGSELVVPMAELAARCNAPIGLFGSTEESLEAASHALIAAVPAVQIASKIAPPMGFDPSSTEARDMLSQLEQSGAKLIFLALGAPKQEMTAALGRQVCPSIGFVSIGAGLDFLSGRQVRAPEWVRAIAMEWLWRALSSPARLGPRYLKGIAILPSLLAHALRVRRQS